MRLLSNHWRLASVRARLLCLALLVLLPTGALTFYTSHVQRDMSADRVKSDALRLSALAGQSQDRLVQSTRQLLTVLAQMPEIGGSSPSCGAVLAHLLDEYPTYLAFAVVTPTGELTCVAPAGSGREGRLSENHIERAIASREFTVGRYSTAGLVSKPSIGFAYPIVAPSGEVQGGIVAALDVRAIGVVAGGLRLPEGSDITVLDRRGTILARHPEQWIGQARTDAPIVEAILTHREGLVEAAGPDAVTRLYAFSALPSAPFDLFVSIGVSKDEAFAEVDQIFYRNLLGLGLVGIVALVGAWVTSDMMLMRPLNALLGAADQLRLGNLRARAQVYGRDEIGTLGRAFNEMAEQLEATIEAEHRAKEALAERVQQLVDDRTREVDLLSEMGELLQACLSLDEAYAVVRRWCPQLFPTLAGSVSIISPTRQTLETVVTWGEAVRDDSQFFSSEDCWALRRGRSHVVDDPTGWLVCRHLVGRNLGYVCIPLMAQGEALGLLHLSCLDSALPCFDDRMRRLAETVAEQLSMALANLKLRETLRTQSILDPLTGLFNRRYMELMLERELQRSIRMRRPMSLILLQVEHHRRFNQVLGHDADDDLLRQFGEMLRRRLRVSDLACRWGGDEIILILPEASLEDAHQRAADLREMITTAVFEVGGRQINGVTFSAGIAAFPEHGETATVLVKAADQALCQSQNEGGGSVVLAEHRLLNEHVEADGSEFASR